MKHIFKNLMLVIMILFVFALCGCTTENVEEVNTLNVSSCIQDANLEKSSYGEKLTYYYAGSNEVSLYYIRNWRNGVVNLKIYFANEEEYNIQKGLYPNADCNDKKLLITVNEYMTVTDMNSYWNDIETSSIYTMYK